MDIPTLFFEDHPNPMLIFDIDTLEILKVNKSATQKYGYTREELRQLTVEDIRPPEDIPKFRKRFAELGEESICTADNTYRHQTKAGEILHVQVTSQFYQADDREVRIVHIHDLTETTNLKNEVEKAYREQQHHIDNNPLGMVKYDHSFRIIEWSTRAEEKTGYTKEEMLGASIFEVGFFDEDRVHFIKERMHELAIGEKDRDRFETTIQLKNGEYMEVLIHASALRYNDGELKSVVAFIENINQRKEYERQLEYRERKYHRLFEDANDGIFLMNDLTFVDCNQQITEIFGVPKKEIIGKNPLDFSPEIQPDGKLSSKKAREKIEKVKKGKPQIFKWSHQKGDGKLIDVEVSLNKIVLGEDIYLHAILRNLTEKNEIKSELKAEQKRLKRAQKLARIGWWDYNVKDDQLIWSDVLYDILGVEKESFGATFKTFNKLVYPDDRPKLDRIMEKASQTDEPLDYILRIGDTNDEVIYVRCHAQSKFNDEGELVWMSGVLQDVTKQKRAQDELRKREELFESLFVDSPVAIVMIDADGRVQKINHSFMELFGYSEEELIGEDLLEYQLPEERYDEMEEIYGNVFADEGSSKYYEDQRVTKRGEIKDLLVGALPIIIDNEPIGAFGIYVDISKLRETENELKSSLKEKEVLLSEIHHRVKNNLAIISGLLLLEAMNWEEDTIVYKVLMQSKSRVHTMAKIHEKLYESTDFADLDLENYVADLVDTVSASILGQRSDVTIDIDCDDVNLNINQALPCALIINELVTNAFKYAFEEGQDHMLEITLRSENEVINIVVADNGPGLPEDFDKMTETSLGHQLVNQLVKQLKGEVNVKSEKGKGTRYKITFEKARKSGSSSNLFV